jgi:outer membrane protein OmpA-like peptidoglycan-associated protein
MTMKAYLLFLCVFIFGGAAFAQLPSKQYTVLIKRADHHYRSKNYQLSAETYAQAFKLNKKVSVNDRFNAACSWAMAKQKDSAFAQLNSVTEHGYTNYEQITTEHDLDPLHKDKRWLLLLEDVKQNIAAKEAKLDKALVAQLDSMAKEKQYYFEEILKILNTPDSKTKGDELSKKARENDSLHLIAIKAILDSRGWPGPDVAGEKGNDMMFGIVRNADVATQVKYLPMIREAAVQGYISGINMATMEDELALKQDRKQIYGTQVIEFSFPKKTMLAPIEDINTVDEKREALGLEPLEKYAAKRGIEFKGKTVGKNNQGKCRNNDFATAIEIRDSIIDVTEVCMGYGAQRDYHFDDTYKEDNSSWFKLKIKHDTLLTFDIVPEEYKDDYDFILFKCADLNCGTRLASGNSKPERLCYSMNEARNGSTGLSEYSEFEYVPAGRGVGYASAIPVKKGEVYYLMVNFAQNYIDENIRPHGYTIYFYNLWPKKPPYLKKPKPAKQPEKSQIILEDLLFQTNKVTLEKESITQLQKVLKFLQDNKTYRLEITGHTDNIGDEPENQLLSKARARAVYDYLLEHGIDATRLFYKGEGSTKPAASNDTENGRKKNRRITFVVLVK